MKSLYIPGIQLNAFEQEDKKMKTQLSLPKRFRAIKGVPKNIDTLPSGTVLSDAEVPLDHNREILGIPCSAQVILL